MTPPPPTRISRIKPKIGFVPNFHQIGNQTRQAVNRPSRPRPDAPAPLNRSKRNEAQSKHSARGAARQQQRPRSNKEKNHSKNQSTPFDGLHAATLPIHEWGKGASKWWSENAAPNIENAIDKAPYLGPAHGLPYRGQDGKIHRPAAHPLKNGGTRLKPNWKGDVGHRVLKGAAVDFPKQSIEFISAVPAATTWMAQETWKNPKATPGKITTGIGLVEQSMVAAAKEDPARFTGAMAAGALIGSKTPGLKARITNRANPYYEPVKVYKGKPNILEGVTGEQPFKTRQPTKTGTVKNVLDPKLTEHTNKYYHGTSSEFVKEIQSKGSMEVASNNPLARSEFTKNRGRVNRGKTVGKSTAAESALFLGAPNTAYGAFTSGGLLRIRGKVIPMSKKTISLAKKREDLVDAGKKVPKKLDRDLEVAAFKDYFNADKGDIIPGPKPLSGYQWVRRDASSGKVVGHYPEWEYVLQPGTKLYPKQSLRSQAYGKLGIKKGNKFTVDPETGEIIEILDLTPDKAKGKPLGEPVVDLGAVAESTTRVKKKIKSKISTTATTANSLKKRSTKRDSKPKPKSDPKSNKSKKKEQNKTDRTNQKPSKSKQKERGKKEGSTPAQQREEKIRQKKRQDTTRAREGAIKGAGVVTLSQSIDQSKPLEKEKTQIPAQRTGIRITGIVQSKPKPKVQKKRQNPEKSIIQPKRKPNETIDKARKKAEDSRTSREIPCKRSVKSRSELVRSFKKDRQTSQTPVRSRTRDSSRRTPRPDHSKIPRREREQERDSDPPRQVRSRTPRNPRRPLNRPRTDRNSNSRSPAPPRPPQTKGKKKSEDKNKKKPRKTRDSRRHEEAAPFTDPIDLMGFIFGGSAPKPKKQPKKQPKKK